MEATWKIDGLFKANPNTVAEEQGVPKGLHTYWKSQIRLSVSRPSGK